MYIVTNISNQRNKPNEKDPTFTSAVSTVFSNDKDNSVLLGAGCDSEYAESADGKKITFGTVKARYGDSFSMNNIKLWHYFGDSRTYHDIIVQISDDPNFSSFYTTVYNNDKDNSAKLGAGANSEYAETSSGLDIKFPTVKGRYVRFYSNGSTANSYNHYVEIEMYYDSTLGL